MNQKSSQVHKLTGFYHRAQDRTGGGIAEKIVTSSHFWNIRRYKQEIRCDGTVTERDGTVTKQLRIRNYELRFAIIDIS